MTSCSEFGAGFWRTTTRLRLYMSSWLVSRVTFCRPKPYAELFLWLVLIPASLSCERVLMTTLDPA